VKYVLKGVEHIPEDTLIKQHGIIEMPHCAMEKVMFEQFIITDRVRVIGNKLKWQTRSNWIEATMGVLEKKGVIHAMNPSITVAIGNILTLEEKFQGGTGVNITPPPAPYVKPSAVKKAKERMERVAKALGVQGYARIDAFMHVKTGELVAMQQDPGNTAAYYANLVEFYMDDKNITKAKEYLNEVANLNQKSADFLLDLYPELK